MKSISLAAAALLSTACVNPDRSRDLRNPAIAGSVLAQQVCSMCHGVTGVAPSPNFPNLAAQTEGYVVAQLTEFRSHSRKDPASVDYMWGMARKLTDAQIADIATYYAKQKPAHQTGEGNPARIEAGRALFTDGAPARGVPACGSCHGDHGQGMATFPRLAGQHRDYVAKQLRVFERTEGRPDGAAMKVAAHNLTAEDIANASTFVQGL